MTSILRALVAMATICAPALALGQSADVDCTDPQTQMAMNHCAALDYRLADEDLNDTYALAMNSWLGGRDTAAGQALLAAQRAWLPYRDAQCAAEAQQYDGGSIQPLILSSCLSRMTRARTEAIRAYAEPY